MYKLNPNTVLKFYGDTINELFTKYIFTLNDYRPEINITNSLYNENIFAINNAFLTLASNYDFNDISLERLDVILNYLRFYILKYNAFNEFKEDGIFVTNMNVFNHIYTEVKNVKISKNIEELDIKSKKLV